MITKNLILLIFTCYVFGTKPVYSQDTLKKVPFFIPQSTSFRVHSNFHWFMYKGVNGKWADQMDIDARLKYTRNIDVIVKNKTRMVNDKLENKFSNIYLTYNSHLKENAKIPIFKYGSLLSIKAGMLEWIPTYTNVQLILENVEKFINPSRIYGGSIVSISPLTGDKALNLHFGAHTGDLLYKKVKPELLNLYLNYTKTIKYSLGLSAQVGIAQGSKHVVNYAYLLYQPKLEEMQFDIRMGKLPSIDQAPYGVHIGFTRKFKYVLLGGYYEKRLNQVAKEQIAGIQWGIVGPPKLVKLVNTFCMFYDFNTTTLWMWIPLIQIDIRHK